jgi:hypothetical protein
VSVFILGGNPINEIMKNCNSWRYRAVCNRNEDDRISSFTNGGQVDHSNSCSHVRNKSGVHLQVFHLFIALKGSDICNNPGLIVYKIFLTPKGIAATPLDKYCSTRLRFAMVIVIESAASYCALMTVYLVFSRLGSAAIIVMGSTVSLLRLIPI